MTKKFTLPTDLYPYQVEDADRMSNGDNFFNFSEMGVGKTPTALWVIEKNHYQCPLIVCPNSLRLEWARQIDEWVGVESAVSLPDTYLRLKPIVYSLIEGVKYKIINYETLRSAQHLEILTQMPFDIIIFDEIHKARNPETKLVKGIWKFLETQSRAKVIGLSGSPIVNYPNDLYVPLSFLFPDEYPRTKRDWNQFVYRWCFAAYGRHGPYIYGVKNIDALKKELAGFVVRHTKEEVLPFLPEKYERKVILEMPQEQKTVYKEMEKELKITLDSGEPLWSPNVLSLLTRLRQINLDPRLVGKTTPSAKTDFLVELIGDTDEKLVIFSCFEGYIDLLSRLFHKVPHVVITGKIPVDQRMKNVTRFQNDSSIKLCLGTIQTMGEGITLTASSNVILIDRWWNQPTNQQATDRLHRIGQKSSVQVIIPVCKDSIDETLDAILERKNKFTREFFPESTVRQMVIEESGLRLGGIEV